MLIELPDAEYPADLMGWKDDSRFEGFVERLAQVLAYGWHVVRASPRLLTALKKAVNLSRSQQTALDNAITQNQRPEELPWDRVSTKLVFTGPLGQRESGGPGEWRLHWTRLLDHYPLPKTVLLAEDQTDAELYLWLGRAYGALHQPGMNGKRSVGEEVQLDLRPAGGQNTPRVLRNALQAPHGPVLCIVDSDQAYPEGALGSVARECSEVVSKASRAASPAESWPAEVVVLAVRSAENIAPLGVLSESRSKELDWLGVLRQRGFLARPEVDPTLCYLKLGKDGETSRSRLLNSSDPQALAYNQAALARICALDSSAPGEDKPTDVVIPRIPKLPGLVVEELKKGSHGHGSAAHWLASKLKTASGSMDPRVETPARAAWSWGLGSPPRIPTR